MSLRWKYLAIVHAAIAVAGAWFWTWHMVSDPNSAGRVDVAWAVAGFLVLSAVLMLAHHCFVATPLRRIVDGAEHLARGDHDHRIEVTGGDELSALALAINSMADRVEAARIELERQVAERTEDLRAVLEEVHERSRIAEEVNRRLEGADRRKTEFLTNVSHELRTPLNSILGFTSLLQDGMYESDEERGEFLRNTRQSAEHLLHLVTDVLSVAQIEAGSLPLDRKALHPGDVIHDVLSMLAVQARDKALELRFEVEGEAMVFADEARLRQILINLVGNAIKFTSEGEVVIRVHTEEESAVFEVRDTGEGIPPDQLERIFEKFHQVDSRSARHAGGTGLGLSICRQLVRLMDGTINAQSDGPGCGALFSFTLPAVIPEAAVAHGG